MEEKSTIHQILGRVESPNAKVVNSYMENTTRWVFDIDHKGGGPVIVLLQHKYASQRVRPAVQSFSLSALSPDFASANVWIEEKADAICINAQRPCRMRVAVDTIHTMAR